MKNNMKPKYTLFGSKALYEESKLIGQYLNWDEVKIAEQGLINVRYLFHDTGSDRPHYPARSNGKSNFPTGRDYDGEVISCND
jgi:hypothetical protein